MKIKGRRTFKKGRRSIRQSLEDWGWNRKTPIDDSSGSQSTSSSIFGGNRAELHTYPNDVNFDQIMGNGPVYGNEDITYDPGVIEEFSPIHSRGPPMELTNVTQNQMIHLTAHEASMLGLAADSDGTYLTASQYNDIIRQMIPNRAQYALRSLKSLNPALNIDMPPTYIRTLRSPPRGRSRARSRSKSRAPPPAYQRSMTPDRTRSNSGTRPMTPGERSRSRSKSRIVLQLPAKRPKRRRGQQKKAGISKKKRVKKSFY